MRDTLLSYLRIIPAAKTEMIAEDLGLPQRGVQDALHQMDDDGEVIMRQGWYRISEAAKMRLGKRVDQE